ncbi:MAG: pectate lyase [Pirellulales bacterium]
MNNRTASYSPYFAFASNRAILPAGFIISLLAGAALQAQDLLERAKEAERRSVEFFSQRVAVHGGYVYQVSADLQFREGEGDAGRETVWVQPPGTPAVGTAYLDAYRLTHDQKLLQAAKAAGQCLIDGQLHSGGWQNHIDFDPTLRTKNAYIIDGPRKKKAKNWSSFDDDQTQCAIRFLTQLDQALEFRDQDIHTTVLRALDAVLANQFPNGAWAQGFEELDRKRSYPDVSASIPEDWPRKHPGENYWVYYTLNDGAMATILDSLWTSYDVYEDERYRQAAVHGAEFLLRAQLPEPQPAWAQQYNFDMHPVWARKFEPPAVSGHESQGVIRVLMKTAERTGERRFLKPIPGALAYLERSRLSDGRLARFYELKTNRPLFFTRTYELTYSDDDLPTHYGFKVTADLDKLRTRYEKLAGLTDVKLQDRANRKPSAEKPTAPSEAEVRRVIDALDDRGAWVEEGSLRYVRTEHPVKQVIRSETFVRNLDVLSRYIAAQSRSQ